MDEKIRHKIAETAHAEYGLKANEIRIDEVERLRRHSCSFYEVGSDVRPLSYEANYAVVSGNQVMGISSPNAAARILDSCSADASADWWAEIITRFHPDLGAGIVLSDENERPDVVRKLIQAGKTFSAPAFKHDNQGVSFLLLNPETYVLYRVEATRTSSGAIDVVKTKVFGGTSSTKSNSDPMDKIAQALR